MLGRSARHLTSLCCHTHGSCQKRWAQVHDVRFLTSHQRPDHVYDKYKDKLQHKAKQDGLNSIDELKAAYGDKIALQSKQGFVPLEDPAAPNQHVHAKQSSSAPSRPSSDEKTGVKTLASFLDVEKTAQLPFDKIELIWRLRHANNPRSLCAAIPVQTYNELANTARRHPQFILPLPKEGQGAEIHFMQWAFPTSTTATVMFTHLAEYKLRGEFSQSHTTVTHHLDLAESNGIVLLQGSVLPDRGVTVDEAKWLLMCLQRFYGQSAHNTPRRKLLQQFSRGDEAFKIEDLLDQAEKIP